MVKTIATTEVRWFLPVGDSRASLIRSWIVEAAAGDARHGALGPQTRADLYLVPCSPLLGVKQRGGGGLELKLRLSTGSLAPIGAIAGRLEQWVKVQAGDPESLGISGGQRWLRLSKQRWSVRLDATASRALSPGEAVLAWCGVEFTELAGVERVTAGLEAFAPDAPGAQRAVEYALQRISREVPELVLREAESCGYPEWLARVGSGS